MTAALPRAMKGALFAVLLSSCGVGPTFLNCPEQAEKAYPISLAFFPQAQLVADRVHFSCKAETPLGLDCYTHWYGSAVAHAAAYATYDIAGECFIHEAAHWSLYADFDDGCKSHTATCGWTDSVYLHVEEATDQYLSTRSHE